jgi:hypothetical protein
VEGDTWGTFIAFSNIQKENSADSHKLNTYLSRIGDPGEADESGQVDDGDEDEHTELLDRIDEKLTETVSTLTEEAQEKQIELTDTLRELSKDVARLQVAQERQNLLLEQKISQAVPKLTEDAEYKQSEDAVSKLTTAVTSLQTIQGRQSLFLYFIIGLLVWLLIRFL